MFFPFLIGAIVVGAIAIAHRVPTPNPATAPTVPQTNASATPGGGIATPGSPGQESIDNALQTFGVPTDATGDTTPSGNVVTTTSDTGANTTTTVVTDPTVSPSPPGQPAFTSAPGPMSSPGSPTPYTPPPPAPPPLKMASVDDYVTQQLGTSATKSDYSTLYSSISGPTGMLF